MTEVNLAKLRLPTFSRKHTSIWFRRADAAFKNAMQCYVRRNKSQLCARDHTRDSARDDSTMARHGT